MDVYGIYTEQLHGAPTVGSVADIATVRWAYKSTSLGDKSHLIYGGLCFSAGGYDICRVGIFNGSISGVIKVFNSGDVIN